MFDMFVSLTSEELSSSYYQASIPSVHLPSRLRERHRPRLFSPFWEGHLWGQMMGKCSENHANMLGKWWDKRWRYPQILNTAIKRNQLVQTWHVSAAFKHRNNGLLAILLGVFQAHLSRWPLASRENRNKNPEQNKAVTVRWISELG